MAFQILSHYKDWWVLLSFHNHSLIQQCVDYTRTPGRARRPEVPVLVTHGGLTKPAWFPLGVMMRAASQFELRSLNLSQDIVIFFLFLCIRYKDVIFYWLTEDRYSSLISLHVFVDWLTEALFEETRWVPTVCGQKLVADRRGCPSLSWGQHSCSSPGLRTWFRILECTFGEGKWSQPVMTFFASYVS